MPAWRVCLMMADDAPGRVAGAENNPSKSGKPIKIKFYVFFLRGFA